MNKHSRRVIEFKKKNLLINQELYLDRRRNLKKSIACCHLFNADFHQGLIPETCMGNDAMRSNNCRPKILFLKRLSKFTLLHLKSSTCMSMHALPILIAKVAWKFEMIPTFRPS